MIVMHILYLTKAPSEMSVALVGGHKPWRASQQIKKLKSILVFDISGQENAPKKGINSTLNEHKTAQTDFLLLHFVQNEIYSSFRDPPFSLEAEIYFIFNTGSEPSFKTETILNHVHFFICHIL